MRHPYPPRAGAGRLGGAPHGKLAHVGPPQLCLLALRVRVGVRRVRVRVRLRVRVRGRDRDRDRVRVSPP